MTRSLSFGLLGATVLARASFAAEPGMIDMDAAVRAVTVFADQATIMRRGEADLPAGNSVLLVHGISPAILRDSVVAGGKATAPVQIGSVETRARVATPVAEAAATADLEQAIRELDRQSALIDVRIASFQAKKDFMDKLASGAAVGSGVASRPRLADDPDSWKLAWTILGEGVGEAAEGLRVAAAEQQDVAQRKQKLSAELDQIRTRAATDGSLDVAVNLHADKPTRFSLSLTYQIPNASWHPVYEARLDSAAGHMLLREEAVVVQRTGEDWKDVALTLSTAHPSAGLQVPSLRPMQVGLYDAQALQPLALAMAPRSGAAMLKTPAPLPLQMPVAQEAHAVGASFDSGGLSVEYRIPGDTNIPSDGTEKKVRIADFDEQASLVARAVPKLEAKAYLQARFASKAEVPLMPGQVSVYLDGVFVGRTSLPLLRPAEEAMLPFGPDDQVKIAYEPQTVASAKEGWKLLGKTAVIARAANINVRSFHSQPIEITVLDQQPVSSAEEIKVEVSAEPQPSAFDFEDKQGVVAWTALYKPGDERRIHFGFTLRVPEGKQILGLPDR